MPSNYEEETPLHVACARGNLLAVETLIEFQVPLNLLDRKGNTPLLRAIEEKKFDVAERLLTVTYEDGLAACWQSEGPEEVVGCTKVGVRARLQRIATPDTQTCGLMSR